MSNEQLLAELSSLLPLLNSVGSSSMERWSKYVPHKPTAKQQEFLDLDCDEALFGGAAGGGKSDALLSWILGPVDVPGYRGLILRRTFPELEATMISRSLEWLSDTDASYNESKKRWKFPSGAEVHFGHVQNEKDKYKYQGREYQRIAFDELTHFTETQYTYLISRLRRSLGLAVKPQIRAGTNPGGEGHYWVKNRFVSQESIDALMNDVKGTFWHEGRAFIPSLIADNPYIDEDEYMAKLAHLGPVMRARLAKGDWSVIEDSILKADWFRYYNMQGQILRALQADSTLLGAIDERECTRFMTVDTAGTSKDKAREKRGKPPSYSVAGVWDYASQVNKSLFLRHIWRDRVELVELVECLKRVAAEWGVRTIYIENATHGVAVENLLRGSGIKVSLLSPHTGLSKRSGVPGKVERSYAFQNMLSEGRVFLPQYNNDWLLPYEQELLAWTGHEDDIADQVDISSYAALVCQTGVSQPLSSSFASGIYRGVPLGGAPAAVRRW